MHIKTSLNNIVDSLDAFPWMIPFWLGFHSASDKVNLKKPSQKCPWIFFSVFNNGGKMEQNVSKEDEDRSREDEGGWTAKPVQISILGHHFLVKHAWFMKTSDVHLYSLSTFKTCRIDTKWTLYRPPWFLFSTPPTVMDRVLPQIQNDTFGEQASLSLPKAWMVACLSMLALQWAGNSCAPSPR